MKFTKGQILVHPHHGPSTVTKIVTLTVKGEKTRYLKLKTVDDDLVVSIPLERTEESGLRPVLDADSWQEVFDILAGPSEPEISNWSRRIKANTDRLRSGEVTTIAGLVRDLTRREQEKGLSFGERNLLRDALEPLVSEVAIALSVNTDEAEEMIEAAILHGVMPKIPEAATVG